MEGTEHPEQRTPGDQQGRGTGSAAPESDTAPGKNFLDLFVVHPDDEPAKNCVASALLVAFPDPWGEQEYTHVRARLMPILDELRSRAAKTSGKTLDMYGRVTEEQLLALMNIVAKTRFAHARGVEARQTLFKSLMEVLAYDPSQANEPAYKAVARALRLEMEDLHANPAAAGLPPTSPDPWELAAWFGEQHQRYGDAATTAWRNKISVTLKQALVNPVTLPGSAWGDDELDDAEVVIVPPQVRDDAHEEARPEFYWSPPPASDKLAGERAPGAEERIVAARSTYTPLAAFTTGSTTWLFDIEIKSEVERLLKLADAADDKSDHATKENALARMLVLATGTNAESIFDLKWSADDGLPITRHPGALSLDARWLLRPELDPSDVTRTGRGVIRIPIPPRIMDRLVKLVPKAGEAVFPHLAWKKPTARNISNKPTLASLAMALPGRLMRTEPWGISLAQHAPGDLRGIDSAPLFYDRIGLNDLITDVARITFPWFGSKAGAVGRLPEDGNVGSRRVPELSHVRLVTDRIRSDHAAAQGDFVLQLKHRMRNAVHGHALQGGLRINHRIEETRRSAFSSEDPLAMVCDKVVTPDWMLRPIALSKRWQEELRRLLMDLVWASKEYIGRPLGSAATAALDGTGPLFLDVVSEDDVRPFGVGAYRQGVPAALEGLENFARQLLNNRLTRRLPEALRVAQLGWHGTREGAWADGSPWSAITAARAISTRLDEVLVDAGWRPLPIVAKEQVPEMSMTCWSGAFRAHRRNYKEMLDRTKTKFDERRSQIADKQTSMLRGYLAQAYPELEIDAGGAIVHRDPENKRTVELTPKDVAQIRSRLAPGDARSAESIVAQNLLHDLVRDARKRGVVAGPLPRRIHARWPLRPGPFLLESALALEQARRLDAAVMESTLPPAAKTFVSVMLHGGYGDAEIVLHSMASGARLSRLESSPGVLLLEPDSSAEDEATRWQRGCLAFHGVAALHLFSWHQEEHAQPITRSELEGLIRTMLKGRLPLSIADGSCALEEIESLAKACNAIRMDGIARLVGTGDVKMSCTSLHRVVMARDGLPAMPAAIPTFVPNEKNPQNEAKGHRAHGLLGRIFDAVSMAYQKLDSGKLSEQPIRDALAAKMRSWLHPDRPPRAAELVALYVLLLLERGGRRKSRLALRTVRDYMYAVGKPLTRFMPEEPMSARSDEWEASYVEIVAEPEDASVKRDRVEALLSFHWVLAQEYEIPEVDFSTLYEMLDISPDIADAGFLSASELLELRGALRGDIATAETACDVEAVRLSKGRSLASLLVATGALRPGEAARMRHVDFLSPISVTGAYVRRSGVQRLKSVNARRRLRASGVLQAEGEDELSAWQVSERAINPSVFQRTMPLFGVWNQPDLPMDDDVLFRRTGMLIRAITRDQNGRTYWLRKTAARDRMEVLMAMKSRSLWPVRDLAREFGHGSIRTTLRCYIHDPVTPFLRSFSESWVTVDAGRIAVASGKSVSRVSRTNGGARLSQTNQDINLRIESIMRNVPLFRPRIGLGEKASPPPTTSGPGVRWQGVYGVLDHIAGGMSIDSAVRAHHWPVAMVMRLTAALDDLRGEYGIAIGAFEEDDSRVMRIPKPRRVDNDVVDELIANDLPSPVLLEMALAWLGGMRHAELDGVPATGRTWLDWNERLPALERLAWRPEGHGRTGMLWIPTTDVEGAAGPWPRLRLLLLAAWIYSGLTARAGV